MTIGHFARVLNYLKILVSPDDFVLLLKKFLKDSYVVNYVAFIAAIEEIVKNLDQHGVMDLSGVKLFLIIYFLFVYILMLNFVGCAQSFSWAHNKR